MEVEEYANILDAWILAENRIVTSKLLSRLMRIHVDKASEYMLKWHEAHSNSHATYVICGSKPCHADIQSAAFESTTASEQGSSGIVHEPKVVKYPHVIHLVAQEDLELAKSQFTDVVGCQIYSLEPAKLRDISMVSACNVHIQEAMSGQSTKIADLSKTYGIIFHEGVHELDQNPRLQQKVDRSIKPIMKTLLKTEASDASEPAITTNQGRPVRNNKTTQLVRATTDIKESLSAVAQPPPLKRSASSSLASAFAKTPKPKPKVVLNAKTAASKEITRTLEQGATTKIGKNKATDNTATKAELEAMMMEEDEVPVPEEVENKISAVKSNNDDDEMLDAADWSASDTEMQEKDPVPDPVVIPLPRRARKKVKKQVHTKDAKGYMVTREEWEWVSCDEEEVPAASLARQSSTTSNQAKTIPKKKVAGNSAVGIASYFTKK